MTKRRWLLVLLVALLLFGYIKFFYKSWSEKTVPESADSIVAIDVKRITNTVIWNAITTPSQWKIGNIFSRRKKETSWDDMVKVPDYFFVFHIKDQPLAAWHVVLDIKSEKSFHDGLQFYGFSKTGDQEYIHPSSGIRIYKNEKQLLVTIGARNNNALQQQVASQLFIQKNYVSKQRIGQLLDTKSHLACAINKGTILNETAVLTAGFDDNKIEINGDFSLNTGYSFTSTKVTYEENYLTTIAFGQPSIKLLQLLNDSAKKKISNTINLETDSLFAPGNRRYQLDIAGFVSRVDSAIVYEYDDDFNQVEKVTVNNVREPMLNFQVKGDSTEIIYNYLRRNDKVEQTETGQLFIALPAGQAFTTWDPARQLVVRSAGYPDPVSKRETESILFFRLNFEKLPEDISRYLPDNIRRLIGNISTIEIKGQQVKNKISLNGFILKKNNDLPLIKL